MNPGNRDVRRDRMQREDWLTVDEAAARLRVHPQTVREWLKDGRLSGTLLSRRAGWRIRATEVERLLEHGPGEEYGGKLAA
jgi:excisionase family DNA binding protein